MAAKKKKRSRSSPKVREDITMMGWAMDAHCTAEIDCAICSDHQEEDSEMSMEDARIKLGDRLLQEGWRHVNSSKYKIMGWVCQACHETPDKER